MYEDDQDISAFLALSGTRNSVRVPRALQHLIEAKAPTLDWLPRVLNTVVDWKWRLRDSRTEGNTHFGYAEGNKPYLVMVAWNPKAGTLALVVRAKLKSGDKTTHKNILSKTWRSVQNASEAASQVREAIRSKYRQW